MNVFKSILFAACCFWYVSATAQCSDPANLNTTYSNNVTTFTWDAVPGAVDYTFELKQTADQLPWEYAEYVTNVSTNSLSFPGITHSLGLDWRVRANCGSAESNFVETQFTLPCPEPSNLTVTNITPNSATLSWDIAPGFNPYVSDFIVCYRVLNSGSNWLLVGHSSTSSINIGGLQPGVTYEWNVSQSCLYFNSTIIISQFTTTAIPCAAPLGLSVSNIGNDKSTVSWGAVAGGLNYVLEYKASAVSVWSSVTVAGTSYTLNNLSVGTAYDIRVKTNCGSNYSTYSATQTFSTLLCVSAGDNSYEWIRLFRIGSINRSSGAEPGGYVNTGNTTSLIIGSNNNTARIRAGFAGAARSQRFSVYIDFDNDGIYESNELVYGAAALTNGNTKVFSVNIPSGVTAGVRGMRVIMAKNGVTINGCLENFQGETEDYLVNLVPSSSNKPIDTGSAALAAGADAAAKGSNGQENAVIWYRDADGDGYGDPADFIEAGIMPTGYVAVGGDCNDSNAGINPGAAEICGNTVDENCDGIAEADNTPPTITCYPTLIVSLDPWGNAVISAADLDAGSFDNCSQTLTYAINRTTFDCADLGGHPVILTVTDQAGNFNQCITNVVIADKAAPVMVCANATTVALNALGEANILPAAVDNGSFDNCNNPLVFSLDKTQFTCADLGTQQVILTAIDPSGNYNQCFVMLEIVDKIEPVAVCVDTFTVALGNNGIVTLTAAMLDQGSTDNCAVTSYEFTPAQLTEANIGYTTVTMVVGDASDNLDLCNTVVNLTSSVTAVYAPDSSTRMRVSPNPSTGYFEVRLQDGSVIERVSVYNAAGRLVQEKLSSNTVQFFDLSQEQSGCYYLQVQTGEQQLVSKLMVVR